MFSDPASNIAKLGLIDGMRVVDIGAGSGFYAFEAAKRVGASGRVYAVDVQKNVLDRIRSVGIANGLRNIEVVWGNAEKIGGTKLREGIADRVIASNVLFQIENKDDFVLEMKRILKPGGKAMIVDWNSGTAMSPKSVVSSRDASLMFEKANFKTEQTFDAGDQHYGLIVSRS